MSKIGPKEAALAALRSNPKLKIIKPKLGPGVVKVERQVLIGAAPPPIQMAEPNDPTTFNIKPLTVAEMRETYPMSAAEPQGKPRRGKSRMKVPKRLRGPESSPAGKKQAVLYAPEGDCSFCDARRTVSREGMRRLRAKPDHGNVTGDVK